MSKPTPADLGTSSNYRKASLSILFGTLAIWFTVSFGCGILFREWMDANMPHIGNAKFGFWMAQQGSIICFVLLLIIYAYLMGKLDDKFGYAEESETTSNQEGAQ